MPTLLPPRVSMPISECSGRVEVKGQVAGATVQVFADGELVAEGLSLFTEVALDLLRNVELTAGQAVTATQQLDGDESERSPEPVIVQAKPPTIGSLVFDSTIYECGRCVVVSGAVPGATVEVHATNGANAGLRGTRVASNGGGAKVNLEPRADFGETFIGRQIACGEQGPDTPMQDVLSQAVFEFGEFHPPSVEEPLYACQQFVKLRDIFPGALVEMERSEGPDIQACFAFHSGKFVDIAPLVEGESIQAQQSFPGCDRKSDSSKSATVLPVTELPAPEVIGDLALCEGTKSITITNLVPGAKVRIYVDGEVAGIAGAPFDKQFAFPIPSVDGSEVSADQGLCNHWSPLSNVAEVVEEPRGIPKPKIPEPLYECGGAVRVEAVKHTWVTVYSQVLNVPIGEAFAFSSGRVSVNVTPLLIRGDHITARIHACGGESKESDAIEVQSLPDIEEPSIPPYLTAGMTSVKVNDLLPGAYVEIFVENFWRGGGYCAAETANIEITGKLEVDQIVAARQRLCLRISDLSQNQTVVPPAPMVMFTPEPDFGEAPLMVSFQNHSTGDITGYLWFFDWDEDVGQAEPDSVLDNPVHVYEEDGVYTVRLVAEGPVLANDSERTVEVTPTQPDPPEPQPGFREVRAYNCHSDQHSLRFWVWDQTAGTDWEDQGSTSHQWGEFGTCPAAGAPFTMQLEDGHTYAIRAIEETGGCGDDPTLVTCIRWDLVIVGDSDGLVFEHTIS